MQNCYNVLAKVQHPLAILLLSAVLWHTAALSFSAWIGPIISSILWVVFSIYRLIRTLTRGTSTLESVEYFDHGCRWKVRTNSPLRTYPGCYFYLYNTRFSTVTRAYGYPVLVLTGNPSSKESVPSYLEFLMRSERFANTAYERKTLYLDGPYGRNLRPELFETVILVAEGIGIAGVLPYATSMLDSYKELKQREIDPPSSDFLVRKVYLFIKYETGQQANWALDQIQRIEECSDNVRYQMAKP